MFSQFHTLPDCRTYSTSPEMTWMIHLFPSTLTTLWPPHKCCWCQKRIINMWQNVGPLISVHGMRCSLPDVNSFADMRGALAHFLSHIYDPLRTSPIPMWTLPSVEREKLDHLKGCGMSPRLVLVSPCFRENVVATCKIGSFLCSLDNLLQKNVIVLFFGNQISKWHSFEKSSNFDLLFTFSSHQGKVTKIPSAHISNTNIHIFCSPYWLFLPYQFWKKYEFIRYGFYLVWVLVLILIRAILEKINK